MKPHLVRTRCLNVVDLVPAVARLQIVLRVKDGIGRKDDIARRKPLAIVPLDAMTQVISDRETIFTDAAILERRNFRCKFRHVVQLVVKIEQKAVDKHIEVSPDCLQAQERIETDRIFDVSITKRSGNGVRGRLPRLDADLRACTKNRAYAGQDRDKCKRPLQGAVGPLTMMVISAAMPPGFIRLLY